jgi:hypothetical protein
MQARQTVLTIGIDSRVPPHEVIDSLCARGREWRESAVPAELRKLNITGIDVRTVDYQFELQWAGRGRPLYNPICFGTVQPYGDGSRIRAGFKIDPRDLMPLLIFVPFGVLIALHPSLGTLASLAAPVVLFARRMGSRRDAAVMRLGLSEILAHAAQQPVPSDSTSLLAISQSRPIGTRHDS